MSEHDSVNNSIYDELGERWYEADDDPVALLRAEARLRNPWIESRIRAHIDRPSGEIRVVDLGCGAGFLTNALARSGFQVTGVDASVASLVIAGRRDQARAVRYLHADARETGLDGGSADVVASMDLLEHVEDPERVVQEASRVLKPGGLFFFHTFNRNWFSKLVVIHLVRLFVRNTPENLHVGRLFVKPSELREYCRVSGMRVLEIRGVDPVPNPWHLLAIAWTGGVPKGFRFRFTRFPLTGYSGVAVKE